MKEDRIDVVKLRASLQSQQVAKQQLISDKSEPSTVKSLAERVKKLEAAVGIEVK